jgi:hypothetical protein
VIEMPVDSITPSASCPHCGKDFWEPGEDWLAKLVELVPRLIGRADVEFVAGEGKGWAMVDRRQAEHCLPEEADMQGPD